MLRQPKSWTAQMADRNREPGRLAFGEPAAPRHLAPGQPHHAATNLPALNQPTPGQPHHAATNPSTPNQPTPGQPHHAATNPPAPNQPTPGQPDHANG